LLKGTLKVGQLVGRPDFEITLSRFERVVERCFEGFQFLLRVGVQQGLFLRESLAKGPFQFVEARLLGGGRFLPEAVAFGVEARVARGLVGPLGNEELDLVPHWTPPSSAVAGSRVACARRGERTAAASCFVMFSG
jgi:hypothetical protein